MTALIILRPDDAGSLAMLHAACFPDPWSPASFRQMLGESHTLGMGTEVDGALAAFAIVRTIDGESDLLTIATDPAHRRGGLARALLTALMHRLGERGTARITLDVAADNMAGLALYKAFGFAEDGRRPRYYTAGRAHPVDAVLMSRDLQIGSG